MLINSPSDSAIAMHRLRSCILDSKIGRMIDSDSQYSSCRFDCMINMRKQRCIASKTIALGAPG
jgi:hypothetical protein